MVRIFYHNAIIGARRTYPGLLLPAVVLARRPRSWRGRADKGAATAAGRDGGADLPAIDREDPRGSPARHVPTCLREVTKEGARGHVRAEIREGADDAGSEVRPSGSGEPGACVCSKTKKTYAELVQRGGPRAVRQPARLYRMFSLFGQTA